MKWSKTILFIGNDLVDFSETETQKKIHDTRFLNRVFNENEIAAIFSSENKARNLWALWSAKEAAFKACQKIDGLSIFSPKAFHIVLNDRGKQGEAHYAECRLDLHWTWVMDTLVHCTAIFNTDNHFFNEWHEVHTLIKKIKIPAEISKKAKQRSSLLRKQFIIYLEQEAKIGENLSIVRPEILLGSYPKKGPPLLYQNKRPFPDYDISLSHDEAWVAGVAILREWGKALTSRPLEME